MKKWTRAELLEHIAAGASWAMHGEDKAVGLQYLSGYLAGVSGDSGKVIGLTKREAAAIRKLAEALRGAPR